MIKLKKFSSSVHYLTNLITTNFPWMIFITSFVTKNELGNTASAILPSMANLLFIDKMEEDKVKTWNKKFFMRFSMRISSKWANINNN